MNPTDSSRLTQYKNKGKDIAQKNFRVTEAVTIRKDKREGLLSKRRNNSTQEEGAHSSSQMEIDTIIHLHQIVSIIRHGDPECLLPAVQQARRVLSSDRNIPINELLSSGILRILVDCLFSDNVNLQYEAAWAITNVASGNSEQTQAVVDAGAVPLLIELLGEGIPNVCEQAVWALGNIIGDGPHFRDYCLQFGLLPLLMGFITPKIPLRFLRNVTWVIGNLCRFKNPPPNPQVVKTILAGLVLLIHHEDSSILVDALWALAFLADGGSERIQLVIDSGIVPSFVPTLGHTNVKVLMAALRTAGNIVTGSDEQTQIVLECGVLLEMPQLLSHPHDKINKEAAWFLSNITAGNQAQVQAVLDASLVPLVIKLLSSAHFSTQMEAAWVVSNLAISGNPDQVKQMVSCNVLQPLCALLDSNEPQIIQVVLDGIYSILKKAEADLESMCAQIEECGGLDKIELLQNHFNEEIYKVAYDITETYFTLNSDVDTIVGQDEDLQQPSQEWTFN